MNKFLILILALASGFWVVGCQSTPKPLSPTIKPAASTEPTLPIGVMISTRSRSQPLTPKQTNEFGPTVSPTITPTPRQYMVKAGDTLFDIAQSNKTTVDALVSLNPGLQPELLSIGQRLILPALEELPPVEPVLSAPVDLTHLELSPLSTFQEPTGNTWILGEVKNNGEIAAENIMVEIDLLDEQGVILNKETAWLALDVLAAGQSAPFGYLFPMNVGDFSTVDAQIVGANSTVNLGNRFLDLAVTGAEVTILEDGLMLTGKIVNQGDRSAQQIQAVVTIYGADNRISGFQQIQLAGELAPNQSTEIKIFLQPPGEFEGNFVISAQGIVVESSDQ